MKVLITSNWVHRYVDGLRHDFPQVEFVAVQNPTDPAVAEAEIAFGPVSSELLQAAKKLRFIQSGSAGVEWMESVPELAETDIMVSNTRGAHATTIAEHTIGMLVFLARNFASLYEAQQQKIWQRPPAKPGVGLVGMTMGIIGLGQIGRAIAVRAHAFEMKIIAADVNEVPRPDYVSELWRLDGLNELLRRSDVVVVATPITNETRGMLGPDQLTLMKPSAYLLVMSRGGIIDEPTLIKMLHEGRLAGAGLDVQAVEPLPADDPLWDAPNVFITPHCSPTSQQTHANVISIMKENLGHYLAGRPLMNLVDKKRGY
jgi:phosphoglycerate dehydrogenase-like enzyme